MAISFIIMSSINMFAAVPHTFRYSFAMLPQGAKEGAQERTCGLAGADSRGDTAQRMNDSGDGWSLCPETGWWEFVGAKQEETTCGPTASEQEAARAAGWRGRSAYADWGGRPSANTAFELLASPHAAALQD